jgi:CheY-like chemotaxis protein
MHHGTIHVQSPGPDKGSTFTLELPLTSPPRHSHAAPAKQKHANEKGLRVLFVDDHADTTLVISKLLSGYGHKVSTAGCAADALQLAGKEQFDIIVSDIGLPDATGYELMQQITSRYSMKGIAMSGYGLEEDVRKSREAGFSDHIVKPANVDQLEQAIRRIVNASE